MRIGLATNAAPEKEVRRADAVEALIRLVRDDMRAVDQIIHDRMTSPVGMIPNLAAYLIDSGGKRIRPMITIAAARLFGGGGDAPRKLAAAVEFIHTATLLHDDVVDDSALRRGRAPANRVWGNPASVLVGDFLFARSFNLMVEAGDLAVLDVLARASSIIAEGEVMQLAAANDADTSMKAYLQIVDAKTAALFSAAARVGVMAAGKPGAPADALAEYGRALGLAFQLVDDALDYGGRAAAMGKNVGDDFREGKITMPVVFAREAGSDEEKAFWRRVMSASQKQAEGDFEKALTLLRERNAITLTLDAARDYAQTAQKALAGAPDNDFKTALYDLAEFVVDRAY
ncbi:MAG: polyprenyl synthetase family protein [Alphaproteobacteria bacterium]